MTRLATLIAPFLIALLALTGTAIGMAIGQADATGRMVICAAHGNMVVYQDADGQPTAPPQYCGDCATMLLAAVATPAHPPQPVPRELTLTETAVPTLTPVQTQVTPHARGPPLHLS